MKKASFLTRLRFSYTFALLEVLACSLRERYQHRAALTESARPS